MLKPISKERVDNLDGSYVIKEIYDVNIKEIYDVNIKEIYDVNYLVDYLSCIKNYDKDNVWIGGISYKDKNFEEILYNYKIKFKEDGSYIKEAIYLTPNKDGIMSFVEEYNKNDKLLNGSYYKAADFKHLILTCTYKYKSNGCYTKFITYFEPNKYGQVSVVEDYDKHDRLLGEKSYENNNFKNLDNLSKHEDEYKNKYKHSAYKDSQNRQFTNKKTSKSSKFGRIIFVILMGIAVFATKVLIHVGAKHTSKTTLYKFVDIILNRTYREDGSYTKTVVRVKPTKDGTMSFVEEYDKDDKLLSGKYYKDREFKEFNYMINYTYRKNGGHTKTVIRTTPDKHGSMSFVEEYDKDDKLLSGKYYKDKEFKELDYTNNRTYRENGSYTYTVIRTTPDKYGSMSFVEEYDKDDKFLSGKYYKDKEFKELDFTISYAYRKNGGHTKTVIRTTPDKHGSMSFVEEYDKDDKLLSGKYYKDKEFKELDYTSKY